MTEERRPDDDSYIVCVKAVVMTRDDSSGGWLAQEGGGLSRVGVCKVLPAELPGHRDFLIHGERLRDRQVLLDCLLKKDLVYTKATPTFHHWKVDDRKCGLTFQSPADARAFDRGVRKAVEDLTDGSTTSSSTVHNEAELGDDDVFMPLPRFPRHVTFRDEDEEIVRINPRERRWLSTGYEDYRHAAAAATARDRSVRAEEGDTYVHFAKGECHKHDYSYPYGPDCGQGLRKGGDGDCGGGVVGTQPQTLPRKGDGRRSRCIYCRDMFDPVENGCGRCQDAPDPVRACIRRASCMWCADSLLYHCLSDPEGDYSDPCSCEPGDERFCLRWMALLGLSLLVPCMCCYPPLRACHRAAVACRCCGGKHKAVS
ncbi:sprouty-related, EVH1 domain-containing protein 2-like isoform X2 [Scleropages formosus]|uniref:sprouty-related, EVH1 domain-containing protein 2-like isoform X2 n=1 Tax=Scleropages formosus TaxID=113540 RepID=UPI0010FA9DC8|nr:sprouty-related, EVH1 domain-containing protein 2-like isoform X2 [Scleropages formosus]